MSRAYKAARRDASREPVTFDFLWEQTVEIRDESGKLQGTEREEKTQHFELHGEVSTLMLSELAYNADLDLADPEAVKLVREFFAQAFGVERRLVEGPNGEIQEQVVQSKALADYNLFFKLHTTFGDDDLLMEIMSGLVEDFMGRPTQQHSTSPSEELSAGESTKVVSLSRGTVQVVPGHVILEGEEGSPEASSG